VAVRVASRIPVAGLIAMSPAPMQPAHGAAPEMLLFTNPPKLPPHSLVLNGQFEPQSMRGNAADLVSASGDGSDKYLQIGGATHVSILFSSIAARAEQEWAAQVLHSSATPRIPSHRGLLGALCGFAGILVLAGPFLREAMGLKDESAKKEDSAGDSGTARSSLWRLCLEWALCSSAIVILLLYWNPLKVIGLFQGDYLASFMLLVGGVLVVAHWRSLRASLSASRRGILGGLFAGIVLLLISTGWFELTFYEAWLTQAKWARLGFLLIALLPYHLAEEHLLGGVQKGRRCQRLVNALTLRLIGWAALMCGILILHNGEILMGLLAPYFALFSIMQRSGMDIVRQESESAGATAVFGAILAAGFLLAIFPID